MGTLLSTVSLSTLPGIVQFEIALNSNDMASEILPEVRIPIGKAAEFAYSRQQSDKIRHRVTHYIRTYLCSFNIFNPCTYNKSVHMTFGKTSPETENIST